MNYKKTAAMAAFLACSSLTLTAFAQAPGGGFGPPPPGGFGQPGGPNGGGPNGGFRRAPFAFGTVTAVDTTGNTITLSTFNGGSQTVDVGTDAQIVTQTNVTVSDLKVGDQVAVQGIPTGITASQLTVGQPPAGLPGAGGFGRPGGFGGPNNGGPGGRQNTAGQGMAMASGTIQSLPTSKDPHLAIALDANSTLFVKVASDAKITKFKALSLSDIQVGDRIMANGQTGDDGTLTASTVGVNLPQPNFGGGFGGGFGGRRGGGGFGGGPGGGPGGFGGGFGGPGGGPGGFGGPGNGGPGGGDQAAPPPMDPNQ